MKAHVLTLFPGMFPGPLGHSLAGKALEKGLWSLQAHNIRDAATDRHACVDDTPFGGGPGMVMRADVVHTAVEAVAALCANPRFIFMTPRGTPLSQERVQAVHLSEEPQELVILCGHYEGIDQRVIDAWGFEEVSVGDYILSGGEMAAMVLLDSIVRLIPGVMGHEASHLEESFSVPLLEYPHYTRPQVWNEQAVPEVLLSGHHLNIQKWRQQQSELITQTRRPDLWQRYCGHSSTTYNY
jgi:tRNA (guanine37-N1)-methyltransferase